MPASFSPVMWFRAKCCFLDLFINRDGHCVSVIASHEIEGSHQEGAAGLRRIWRRVFMLPCYSWTCSVEDHLHGLPSERVSQMSACAVCSLPAGQGISPKRASGHVLLDRFSPLLTVLFFIILTSVRKARQFCFFPTCLKTLTCDN